MNIGVDNNTKPNATKSILQYERERAEKSRERAGLLMVFLVMAVSGMEYFCQSQNYIFVSFLIGVFFCLKFSIRPDKNFYAVAAIFLVVETFQYLMFGGFNMRTFAGTYIRLFLAFTVVKIVRQRFLSYFVRIMYFFSIVSLFFYAFSFLAGAQSFYLDILANLIPNPWVKLDGFYHSNPNIVIYCFHDSLFSEHRNSGPFWEPGGFIVFLMLALVFNHPIERSVVTKKNIVFILCIITTFSTAGYVALFLFLTYTNFNKLRSNYLYVFIFAALIFLLYFFFQRLSFLKDKIETNIVSADVTTTSRFGSALADFGSFKKSPWVGWGRAGAKDGFISSVEFSVENHRNNGVFYLLATYGIFLTLFYFRQIFIVFLRINRKYKISSFYAISAFLIMIVIGFSQSIFLRPFFYCLIFLPFAFYSRENNNHISAGHQSNS